MCAPQAPITNSRLIRKRVELFTFGQTPFLDSTTLAAIVIFRDLQVPWNQKGCFRLTACSTV